MEPRKTAEEVRKENAVTLKLVPCTTLDWPMVDQMDRIVHCGNECVAMPPEDYEALWDHAAHLEEQLHEAVIDIEYLRDRVHESYRDALERAASLCEAVEGQCMERDEGKWPEMRQEASVGAAECSSVIRSVIEQMVALNRIKNTCREATSGEAGHNPSVEPEKPAGD